MVMTPYNNNFKARSYYFDSYDGSTTYGEFPISNKSLYGIKSYHGDYHSPTDHAYTKHAWRGWYGQIDQYGGGKLQSRRTGAMPYPYSSYVGTLPSGFSSNALAAAISDAYSRLRGDTDLSIDLVQWRQVVKMMAGYRSLIKRTIKQAIAMKPAVTKAELALSRLETGKASRLSRRRLKRLAREANAALNFVAEQRLIYVYGIKPTMQSCYELGKIAVTPKEPGHLRVEGKGKVIDNFNRVEYPVDPKVAAVHTIRASYRARVVMYFTPTGDVLEHLSEISSLNPASILYELTPFSFILDWIVDFGGWIRTLETAYMHRNNFVGGYQTQTVGITMSSVMNGRNGFSPTGSWASYGLSGSMILNRLSRSGLHEAPFPARPVMPLKLGAERSLNAIALAKAVLLRADDLLSHRRV